MHELHSHSVHDVTAHKATTRIFIAVKGSDLSSLNFVQKVQYSVLE
jgi:hypothetical protein